MIHKRLQLQYLLLSVRDALDDFYMTLHFEKSILKGHFPNCELIESLLTEITEEENVVRNQYCPFISIAGCSIHTKRRIGQHRIECTSPKDSGCLV